MSTLTSAELKTRRQALEADLEQALIGKLIEVKGHNSIRVDPDRFVVNLPNDGQFQVYSVGLHPRNDFSTQRLVLQALLDTTDDDEGEDVKVIEKGAVTHGMWMDVLTDAFERAFPASLQKPYQKTGAELIAAERQRQRDAEGFSSEHDLCYTNDELLKAAKCYIDDTIYGTVTCGQWPWSVRWWKPSSPIRNLVKAGALIAAELDRLLAIEATNKETKP